MIMILGRLQWWVSCELLGESGADLLTASCDIPSWLIPKFGSYTYENTEA
jgi:hypothetical protein